MSREKRSVEENLGLVHLCARRFSSKGIEYEDLFQAGCLGLIKAIDGFDDSRGVQFSTYAVPVILGEIRRLFREGTSIRISRTVRDLARRAKEVEEKMLTCGRKSPTVSEIAEELHVSPQKAAAAIETLKSPVSLTSCENSEEMDIPVDAPEEVMTDRISLFHAIETLEEKDRKLIHLRYFEQLTQSAVADRLDMSQVQVSRREKKILLYLRMALSSE